MINKINLLNGYHSGLENLILKNSSQSFRRDGIFPKTTYFPSIRTVSQSITMT